MLAVAVRVIRATLAFLEARTLAPRCRTLQLTLLNVVHISAPVVLDGHLLTTSAHAYGTRFSPFADAH